MSSFTMRINDTTITFQCDSDSGKATPISRVAEGVTAITEKEKQQHISFIKEGLKTVEETKGREAKAACAKIIYDYMFMCAIDFVKTYEKFKKTVIDKAYELKKEAPEITSMIASLDKVLVALEQPLEKPAVAPTPVLPGSAADTTARPMLARQVACGGSLTYCGCEGCPDLTVKDQPVESKPANTVVEPAKSVSEPAKTVEKPASAPAKTVEKPAAAPTNEYDPEVALFVSLAKKYKATWAASNAKEYLSYFKEAVKRGYIKGDTFVARLNAYLSQWDYDDETERTRLMKSIVEKEKLVFSDPVMLLYYDWEKTYKPTGKTNRYIKMRQFVNIHKSILA